ncbi:uncharacterized protein BX663DRAFT_45173 [Cokeromyces recurvatus]|uniref:uncharacterized protein n=1 Tax=Cokeromyces recurvatus TaxID=90255 RepID=UPI0022202D9E|nr:uncharacterized protein BX663DRAFT_45173 [Cokeromyces recurvatus]KAI7903238.1 hypothetical protein BX663DRAFT_45173 [Cokeromyces recurvatus]
MLCTEFYFIFRLIVYPLLCNSSTTILLSIISRAYSIKQTTLSDKKSIFDQSAPRKLFIDNLVDVFFFCIFIIKMSGVSFIGIPLC